MKLQDFGLWFRYFSEYEFKWSASVPQSGYYDIYYDGQRLVQLWNKFSFLIHDDKPHIAKLKIKFIKSKEGYYLVEKCPITLDDFEIMENPDYRGPP